MKKLIFIFSLILVALVSYSQDVVGSRVIAKQSVFIRDRWIDSVLVDTSLFQSSNRSIPTAGAVYDFVVNRAAGSPGSGTVTNVATGYGLIGGPITTTGTLFVDSNVVGTKQWVYNVLDSLPTITATEGITAISNNVMLGGILTSPASLLTNRRIDLNGKALYFTKGLVGTDTTAFDTRYTPFVVDILDSLTVDENFTANYDLLPKHGGTFKRTIRYYPPAYKSINRGGFKFILQHEAGDSALIRTDGGDYQYPLMGETRLKPLTGHTGQTVFRVGNGGGAALRRNEGVPSVVANMFIDSTSASSYVRVNGHLVGFRSYVVAANSGAPDSINAVVHYSASSFINSPSWVSKQYVFAPDVYWNRTDSAFLFFDTARNASSGKPIRAFWRAKTRIGANNDWTSPYQFAVGGSSLFEDSIVHGQRLAVTDTTGVDIMVRDRSTGILKYITADNLGVGGGGGSSLFPTTGTGTATGNVIGDLDGNELTIMDGATTLFHMTNQAFNFNILDAFSVQVTGDDLFIVDKFALKSFLKMNDGTSEAGLELNTNSIADVDFRLNANNGTNEVSIYGDANANSLSYEADTHTFTGAVLFSSLANDAGQDRIVGQTASNGQLGYITIGSGLDLTAGVLTATGGGSTDTTSLSDRIDRKFSIAVISSNNASVGDAETRYFGSASTTWHGSPTALEINIDRNCTLATANITIACGSTAGSAEDWTIYIRNNTTGTDYAIATVSVSANNRVWTNTAMNIPLTAGDKIIIKSITPTFATNPAGCLPYGYLTFK